MRLKIYDYLKVRICNCIPTILTAKGLGARPFSFKKKWSNGLGELARLGIPFYNGQLPLSNPKADGPVSTEICRIHKPEKEKGAM